MSETEYEKRTTGQEPSFVKEVARDVGTELKSQFRNWVRWTMLGAAVGALVLGGIGLWFFGTTGLALGALVGAVAGGGAGLVFYYQAS